MQKQGISRAALSPESAGRSVRVLRLGALLRTAGRSSPREAGLRHASLCRMPWIATPVVEGGPAVAKWESLADPLLLVEQMWNHGGKMSAAFAEKKLAWVRLTSQELTDVMAYLQDLPETPGGGAHVSA